MKDGLKTTEFWAGLVTMNVMYWNDVMGWGLSDVTVSGMVVLVVSYVLGRSAVKSWMK